jgi:hypothetical protein
LRHSTNLFLIRKGSDAFFLNLAKIPAFEKVPLFIPYQPGGVANESGFRAAAKENRN